MAIWGWVLVWVDDGALDEVFDSDSLVSSVREMPDMIPVNTKKYRKIVQKYRNLQPFDQM